jgi:D-3-phosphoglycerate dehydrogenase
MTAGTVAVYGHTFAKLDIELAVLGAHNIQILDGNELAPKDMAQAGVTGILLGTSRKVDRTLMTAIPSLKAVVRQGIGVDNIDIPAATERGILVCNVTDYCIEEVAVHALACALALMRKLPFFDANVRRGAWRKGMPSMFRPSQSTVGVIGYGQIGRAFVARAKPIFGTVLVFDAWYAGEPVPGVTFVADVDDLLARADVISIHAPLTPQTRGLIDAKRLARMKPHAVLINASRGGIVDEEALVVALREGAIAGAALDTFLVEPLPKDHVLTSQERLILTPHVAWVSRQAEHELREHAAEEMVRVLSGETPRSPVNKI